MVSTYSSAPCGVAGGGLARGCKIRGDNTARKKKDIKKKINRIFSTEDIRGDIFQPKSVSGSNEDIGVK